MQMLDVVIRTHQPLTANDIANLENLGLRLVASLDNQAYRVRGMSDADVADLLALNNIAEVIEVAPMAKLDATLRQSVQQAMAAAAEMSPAAAAAAPSTDVLVSLDPASDVAATLADLEQIGEVKANTGRRVLIQVAANRIPDIAALPGVLSAEIEPKHRTQNNIAHILTQVTPVATDWGLNGSGEIIGVADSGLDTGVNDASLLADFAGRVVNIRATVNKAAFGVADGADLNNHGTHVCGSILGDGANSNSNLAGMAPAAQLTMLAMGPNNSTGLSVPIDLTVGVFQDAYNDGARLHSNSWGDPTSSSAGAYTGQAADVDEFIRNNPDMLILIAAGNQGSAPSSVTPPGTAKNCLTVGAAESVRPLPMTATLNTNLQDSDFNPATPNVNVPLSLTNFDDQADNSDEIASFSGRGPTDDQRIKPDIVAPGTWILSCRSQISTADVGPDGLNHVGGLTAFYADDADGIATHTEAVGRGLPGAPIFGTWDQNTPDAPPGSGPIYQQNYFYSSGTSMATPITTGATALLRQYLRQRRGVSNPTAALMKALLINGATVPAGESPAPNNNRGFGWLNLENTLRPAPTGQQSFSDDVDLAVATGDVRSFSVQLAEAGHPLRVTLTWTDAPGIANFGGLRNRLYLRVLAPDSTPFDGDVTAFPTVSNNVQRVHIETPIAGVYTIEVHGIEVTQGIAAHPTEIRQDFALAVINGLGFSPQPVDISQVLDRSGSMDFYGYMTPVKERARQFVDLLRINDRTGVVSFSGLATVNHPVVAVSGLATQVALKNTIDAIIAGGNTSIGGGLQQGMTELATGGDPSHPQAMVLLSDGFENTPPWVGGGATDSPPSWYGGPDFSEVLPALPAGLKVYTVSLGVQSDQVLLQDIANLTGGVFHAIHSPADIGELHQIYVHLQALTGGEEVISTGSSTVSGFSVNGASALAAPVDGGFIDGVMLADLQRLNNLSQTTLNPALLRGLQTTRVHHIPVDESISSLTLLVSWHDPAAPVSLTLVSPALQVIQPGNSQHFNQTGSSYQFFRIEHPQPGVWQMQVQSGKPANDGLPHRQAYTWGAYATTPLGIRCQLPQRPVGLATLKFAVNLVGSKGVARSVRMSSVVKKPLASLAELLATHHDQLAAIDLPFEPDNPKVGADLYKLAALDRIMQEQGQRSIFRMKRQPLRLVRENQYTDTLETPVSGLYTVPVSVMGTTRGGFTYQRQARFSIRI